MFNKIIKTSLLCKICFHAKLLVIFKDKNILYKKNSILLFLIKFYSRFDFTLPL